MYYCEICGYETESKSKLQKHHIIPKELNGTNDKWNLVYLCPSCHTNVYIPDSKFGNHSMKTSNSIIILSKKLSNYGMTINYIDKDGIEMFKDLKNI